MALALVLVARILWVGVVDANTYRTLGLKARERSFPLNELRGSILDRNGEALVMSVPTKLIAVDPTVISDPEGLATTLAALLGMPRPAVVDALERPDTRYSVVARQVQPDVVAKVRAAKLSGLVFADDPQRVNVNGTLGRSVLGSMDRFGEQAVGGVELQFDPLLRDIKGEERIEQGIGGSTIPCSEQVVRTARPGSDVTLTLDRSVQFIAENELAKQVAAVGARGGSVVVGRPQTGEILAMASVSRREGKPDGDVIQGSLNQTVRLYEPGSVMKLVTIATAIEQGLVTPETTFSVPDSIRLYDRTVNDSHHHGTETMTVAEILAQSSNVGTIKIAQRIEAANGIGSIVKALGSFGFGRATALGLPLEQAGVVKTKWNGTDIASIPIGQSITVTPTQLWAAYNVIANDGLYVPPKLVRDVVDAEGHHNVPATPKTHRVVTPATSEQVTNALEKVVEEGTGKGIGIPGFNIAAKTGTAYKVLGHGKGYGTAAERKYDASFVGFFPATNPQITIMVMIDEPAYGKHFGAVAAGPVFEALAQETMRRYSIAQDNAVDRGPVKPARSQAAVAPTTTTTVDPNAPTTTAPPTPPTTTAPTTAAAKAAAATKAAAPKAAATKPAATRSTPATSPTHAASVSTTTTVRHG